MTPANERKAKERKAKRDAGLVRVEVWVPRGDLAAVRLYLKQRADVHMIRQLDQPTTKG